MENGEMPLSIKVVVIDSCLEQSKKLRDLCYTIMLNVTWRDIKMACLATTAITDSGYKTELIKWHFEFSKRQQEESNKRMLKITPITDTVKVTIKIILLSM